MGLEDFEQICDWLDKRISQLSHTLIPSGRLLHEPFT